jgi:hypothetical protein
MFTPPAFLDTQRASTSQLTNSRSTISTPIHLHKPHDPTPSPHSPIISRSLLSKTRIFFNAIQMSTTIAPYPDSILRKLHRNGFNSKFHLHQVGSWVVYSIQLILFFTILFPTFTETERIAITVPYVAIFLTFNIFFILAEIERHTSPYVRPGEDEPREFCQWCGYNVRKDCKHCRCCNVCRRGFDHHCFFLNNCVAEANYKWFALGIAFLTVSAIFTTLVCIWVIMSIEYEDGEPLKRASELYGSKVSKPVVYVFTSWLLFQELGIEVFMIYLVALHLLLWKRKITTFELILYRRQLQRERAAMGRN